MAEAEIATRIALCARIFDAWPNARPMNRDRTLIEYVNATRGVPIERLGKCVQLAIDAGGNWMPAAGEILQRAAVQADGGAPVGTDREERFWHEKRVRQTVSLYMRRAEQIAPLSPDLSLHNGPTPPKLEASL